MLASSAHVVTILEARAFSMAALIFLSGDELIVHDNCQLMFHTYSGIFSGKGNEQQAEVAAVGNWFEKIMTRLCTPFLSDTEVSRILKGADLWMDSDQIRRRLMRKRPSTRNRTPGIRASAKKRRPRCCPANEVRLQPAAGKVSVAPSPPLAVGASTSCPP